ncbi:MAG: sensor domain-containing diguanylate cyclase [Deltaproteobacteria bacterium]|nr:sensor domain-containing diguanylate cyclase [Deltaproteobacteria bacterium]
MLERALVISRDQKDRELFQAILGPKGFDVDLVSMEKMTDNKILNGGFAVVLVDYDLVGGAWVRRLTGLLKEERRRPCLILYGEKIKPEELSDLLQSGVYGFVPRTLIPERICDTLMAGLENTKGFMEVMGVIDDLKKVNEKVEKEKERLRTKNQELLLMNKLSKEIAYELNWGNILPRIIKTGLLEILDACHMGILYKIGAAWYLAFHSSHGEIGENNLRNMAKEMTKMFHSFSGETVKAEDVSVKTHKSGGAAYLSCPISLRRAWIQPLEFAGRALGLVGIIGRNSREPFEGKKELLSTIANILAISLKNAQEYHRVGEMAVTDGLTGVYNRKGFRDLMAREFQKSLRYRNPLSLVMIDVDNFKEINDSLGHQGGDHVLQEIARCLKKMVRRTDIVARYGGDEFVILIPETGMERAEVLMRRISGKLETRRFTWCGRKIKVEISYGISSTDERDQVGDEDELISKADTRLYEAKRSKVSPVIMKRASSAK